MSSERIGLGLRAVVRLDESGQECRRGEPLTPEALERKIQRLDRSASEDAAKDERRGIARFLRRRRPDDQERTR